jgi:hypothetical protein
MKRFEPRGAGAENWAGTRAATNRRDPSYSAFMSSFAGVIVCSSQSFVRVRFCGSSLKCPHSGDSYDEKLDN